MEEIRDISQWSIAKSAEIYEDLLGEDWIKAQLKGRDDEALQDRYAILEYRVERHPVIAYWPWDADEPWRDAKEKFVPRYLWYRFSAPAFSIYLVKDIPGFDLRSVKNRLRTRTDFESFAYECKIASIYHRCGYNVRFLPEKHEPTPDLVITCGSGKVYAECKIREFTAEWRAYNKRAAIVAAHLFTAMEQSRTNLAVSVESPDALKNIRGNEIGLELTVALCKRDDSSSFAVGTSTITWKKSGDFGLEMKGLFPLNLSSEVDFPFDGTRTGIRDGIPYFVNPRTVNFHTSKPIDQVRRLRDILSKAIVQVAKYPPSVVYLELEEGSTKKVEESEIDSDISAVMDPEKSATYDSQTAVLKHVIFTAVWWTLENGKWDRPTRGHEIPNKHSTVEFPRGFLKGGKFFPGIANVQVLETEARNLRDKGDFRSALDLVEFALLHDGNLETLNLKATFLNQLDRLQDALQVSNDVIRIDPRNANAWTNRALSLLGLKNLSGATESMSKALGINPNSVAAWSIRGMICLQTSRRTEAVQCLEMARSIDPSHPSVDQLARLLSRR